MGKEKKRRDIPVFTTELVETHCHLDYLKNEEIEQVLLNCKEKNINRIITIAVETSNLHRVLEIAKNSPEVFTTQGIHPHNSGQWSNQTKKIIKENIKEEKVIAIGEIGLDYYYDKNPRDIQIKAFEDQLELAIENELPVVIHTRDAETDTMAIVKNVGNQLKNKAVIHSFTSKKELADLAVSMSLYIGINGIVTFKNAQGVRDAISDVPVENILIETDAPFLTPVPYRGKENAPYYLPFVAEKMAELKDMEIEDFLKITTNNAYTLFDRLK